jgi:hypothetical protein
MIYEKSEYGGAGSERLVDMDELGRAEELALAALAKQLNPEVDAPRGPVLPAITEAEITSREAQGITRNSRHNIVFLKQRFPHRFCLDGSRRVAGFPREEVEQYMRGYLNAEVEPEGYDGRRISSFVTEEYSLESVFRAIRYVGIPIRFLKKPQGKLVAEYVDKEFIELIEEGLAELEESQAKQGVEPVWQAASLDEQLRVASIAIPKRGPHHDIIAWDDDLLEITHIPPKSKPLPPAWLYKPAASDAISWQPRYTRSLNPLVPVTIAIEALDPRLGINATIALAARHTGIVATPMAIGLNQEGAPAVNSGVVETLSELIASTEYDGDPIPDNWQILEDVARDANVKLDGEDGLEAWVAEGSYGPKHIITIPYREANVRRHLTFCSPQLARVIVDWVLHERQRLERAIELEEKYGRPGFDAVQAVAREISEPLDADVEDGESKEAERDAIEELRSKLQSLEMFAAQHSLEVQWVYELVHAEHDAYIVDYVVDGRKQVAHFATTEGVEYLLEHLAPPEYRTGRQICDTYGIPLYLFDFYAEDTEPAGNFLSNEWCANVHPLPHYAPEQINHILSNYYSDVADEPMRVTEMAAKTGQTINFISSYLMRHGVKIDKNRSVLRQAGLRFLREHQEIETADESAQTPTLFLMRTREARGCDLEHADVTTMCYELGIPLVTLRNVSAKKTTQHAPADRIPDLQAAIERYYIRSK